MGRSGSVIVGIIMVAVMFVLFPIVMDSTHELQTDSYTQTEAAVVTGVGVAAADVVLDEELWSDSTTYVTSVASDNVADTPAVGTYTAGTQTLNVTGLAESDTRTLTIVYLHDGLTDYTGMGAMVAVAPLLLFLGVIGAVIGGLYMGFKH
jgi:hypothetical protein